VRALLSGPTRAERRAGLVSTFGTATRSLRFSLTMNARRRYAVVDLNRAILAVEFAFVSTQEVAQIVSTIGQFPRVEWVVILVDGMPLCRALREC
jgi:spore germination protein GerM